MNLQINFRSWIASKNGWFPPGFNLPRNHGCWRLGCYKLETQRWNPPIQMSRWTRAQQMQVGRIPKEIGCGKEISCCDSTSGLIWNLQQLKQMNFETVQIFNKSLLLERIMNNSQKSQKAFRRDRKNEQKSIIFAFRSEIFGLSKTCCNTRYHGIWKSQKKSHSTLRAKRATFWVDKSSLKMPKMVPFRRVFENLNLAVKQCYQTGQF